MQEDSLRVWFLEPFAIQGTANLLDLGPIFDKGGAILCQSTWTLDGGSGADDLAVWVTTQGQVAVYQGLDPSDANNWALVGIPCVGVPGANSWKKHYTRLLADFERVFVFADGDQPGKEFATALSRELPVTTIQLPDGEDVNSMYVKEGSSYFHKKVGTYEV